MLLYHAVFSSHLLPCCGVGAAVHGLAVDVAGQLVSFPY
jgi:hypothetical protein